MYSILLETNRILYNRVKEHKFGLRGEAKCNSCVLEKHVKTVLML